VSGGLDAPCRATPLRTERPMPDDPGHAGGGYKRCASMDKVGNERISGPLAGHAPSAK